MPESYRALVVRNRVDQQFLAIQQQHERLQDYCGRASGRGLSQLSGAQIALGTADVEFFLAAVRKMRRVCELVRKSRLLIGETLKAPLKAFCDVADHVTNVRNLQDHMDEAAARGEGGVGYGITGDRMTISHNGVVVDTLTLYQAAEQLHAAIRAVVDPIAALDVHGGYPIIDLTGGQPPRGPGTTESEGSFHSQQPDHGKAGR
ncbi:hypothetical protein ACIGXM_28600 [Kitasatospora sp. NPDC052896]|uniref:hypothetical protein n=1 Tax=Kitasatospora sp. NPDC052896 TaxID=3364061 RepID=UPI0037C5AD7F